MAPKQEKSEWEFPHLREAHQIPGVGSDLYAVKFYPYTEPGVDPVFAVVGGKHIFICRPPSPENRSGKTEVVKFVLNEGKEEDHYACAWTVDLETNTPLLCVAGSKAKIQIINALTGELVRTLIGHGGEIEDLAVSPVNPYILASAAEDATVRIWSLDPAHAKQPYAAILEGEGHRSTILTLSFHASGRYLLSGGIDRIINLWTLPVFPDSNTGSGQPTRIFYPHFSSSEINVYPIDCVAFHGDLILSKAANEDTIVLWAINGFTSSAPPPPPSTAPTTHDNTRATRSAFLAPTAASSGATTPQYYTRIMQFKIPDSEVMFMRFSLFPGTPSGHPILAFCNTSSKVFFWDLDRLEQYYDWASTHPAELGYESEEGATPDVSSSTTTAQEPPAKRPAYLLTFQRRHRGGGFVGGSALSRIARANSPTESASSNQTGSDAQTADDSREGADGGGGGGGGGAGTGMAKPITGKTDWEKTRTQWAGKYEVGNALTDLEPHREEVVKGYTFTGRQVAWSADGEWCVVVGSSAMIAVFQRWAK